MKFERLGDILHVSKGKKPTFCEQPSSNSSRVLQIEDLRSDDIMKFTDEENGVLALDDDLLLAWDGANAGTVGFGKTGFIGSTIARLRKKFPDDYSTVFLGKFLQSKFQVLREGTTGATIPHINRKTLDDLKVPKLPIDKQHQVAEILSKAEALIAKRKESIELLDEYLKSTFLEMFGDPVRNEKGWEKDTIDNVCKDIVDCVNKTAPIVDYPTEYIMIRTTNIRNYKINFNGTRYVTKDVFEKWTRRLVPQKGDIIFTREAPTGEAAIIDFDNNVFLGQRTMQFRPNVEVINKHFLLYQLMGPGVKQQINKLGSGSTVKHLSVPACKKFVLMVPPIQFQNRFGHIVEKVESCKAQYTQSLYQLESLYSVLSNESFN